MARAQKISSRQDGGRRHPSHEREAPQDWQTLRHDLLDLLNEVEEHAQEEHAPQRGGRLFEEAYPSEDTSMPNRHRAALNSVTQTLERFSNRDEDYLSNAIEKIRKSQSGNTNRPPEQLQGYKNSVQDISSRLEGLGGELRGGNRSQTDVSEIASQVGQLTRTVELLAGAVGESGQVRRLESQIAELAQAMQAGPRDEKGEVNQRLERLAVTIEQMTDMHHQLADRPVSMIEELSASQNRGFGAIEEGVRGIYDRLDSLEQHPGIDRSEFERFGAEMAQLADALQSGASAPGMLLSRVDALNARLNQVERNEYGDGSSLRGLQSDVEALRDAVRDAVEPRLSQITDQIDSLGGKIGKGDGAGDLEDHIRQLIARMDQTGEQLAEISQLYATNPEVALNPDLAALAELVAERTSKAMSKNAEQAGAAEGRVQEGIQQVDARLARLESLLNEGVPTKSAAANRPNSAQTRPVAPSAPQSMAQPFETAPVFGAPKAQPTRVQEHTAPDADSMRANPSFDAPLIDPSFAPPQAEAGRPDTPAMQAEGAPTRPRHPLKPADSAAPPAGFDPSRVEPPKRPMSSFADDDGSTFAAQNNAPSAQMPDAMTNRNTFIEAARRAAQRHEAEDDDGDKSIISRLFSKLRRDKNDDEETQYAEAPAPAYDDGARQSDYRMHDGVSADSSGVTQQGFFTRHRRPLLLAGMVVLVSLLALNLLERRLNGDNTSTTPVPEASTPTPSPQDGGVPIQPMLDPKPTGSVDPFMRQIAGPPALNSQELPAAVSTNSFSGASTNPAGLQTSSLGPRAAALPAESAFKPREVKLELPPEDAGPLALREAAAAGDKRAQFEVAAILGEGKALPKDMARAAEWYEHSAVQRFAPAEYRLGNIYEHGHGVSKDLNQAIIWYERAAQSGNRMSMHNLAALHASGELGKQDFPKAAEWFERAAGLGLTDSQFNLGMLYARGLGVQQDMAVSYKWFSLAAARGDDGAAKARDDVARSLGSVAVNQLKAEISKWRPLSINMEANFAPIGTWAEDFNPGQPISEKKVVEQVQAALQRLGYDVGTPDGLMGPRTRDAIAEFERATGMNESGAVNPRLLAVLGSQPV